MLQGYLAPEQIMDGDDATFEHPSDQNKNMNILENLSF
jgi:hypothetical protein